MKDKYILGLNGCHCRSHDAAACLIKNNQIIAIAEEERFIRQKRALDKQPINSAKFCLEKANIGIKDLSAIAVGFKLSKRRLSDVSSILPKEMFELDKKILVIDVKHHLSHAASVFYTSEFKEAAILVIDGQGENESTSIFYADSKDITFLKSYSTSESLGFLYSSISEFCGLGGFGAGKLMGLSAYGKPVYGKIINSIYSSVRLDDDHLPDNQTEFSSYVASQLIRKGFKPAQIKIRFNEFTGKIEKLPVLLRIHKDLAASAQSFIENKMLDLAREAEELTGSQNLCLSGGVALNCVANSIVENARIFKRTFIQPACEDSGSALGAALAVSKEKISGKITPYYGSSYSNASIRKILHMMKIRYKEYDDIIKITAKLLTRKKIIGWFQGGMEYGPRALGNRSVLADPRDENMKVILNNAKGREIWRPFGPSVLEERGEEIFKNYVPSPFMLKSFEIKKEWIEKIPAVVHVDKSTRPQTVNRRDNGIYYNLIKEFYNLTGVPMIVNTSFNYAGEPMVCSPHDAIRTFFSSGLDYLVMGDYLIDKGVYE